MADTRITINGQHYGSPEEMPPDVRRAYDEAMRMLASGGETGRTVVADPSDALGGDLIVNRVVTVDNRKYASIDDLPPEVRKLYEDAVRGAASPVTRPETSLHVSVDMTGPGETPRPGLEPASELESTMRGIPEFLGIVIVIALILLYILTR